MSEELEQRYFKHRLHKLIDFRFLCLEDMIENESLPKEGEGEDEDENEDEPEYEHESEGEEENGEEAEEEDDVVQYPLPRISIVDFDPATIDQKQVCQFIEDNPDISYCFDMTWFALDKDVMFDLYNTDREAFEKTLARFEVSAAKWKRIEMISDDYWSKLYDARLNETIEDLEARVIPNHPTKFPRFLWEEETRKMRNKDKEFADLLTTAGNDEAQKWYRARQEKTENAKGSINRLMSEMDDIINQKKNEEFTVEFPDKE
eukprot:CAMPEP_0117019158 /NCGR_PEP_ID=MMETSP0472-20121206/14747_1 /TAXON_ID=693140 ORGANISM="Tiarina fusus, Strain LIS" /NCGR_SAMPLE_ID=MMETSP0472 /ASSEMBLY_ACC=CAM_ASM_000603 /LENGTH=260 /DNA_ID=CAMNT_0004724065 /DNA_START=567 /DNA_END=1349 /DNA_ORIENTATION=-